MDWPEIWRLMEVSTMFFIYRYCVFTYGRKVSFFPVDIAIFTLFEPIAMFQRLTWNVVWIDCNVILVCIFIYKNMKNAVKITGFITIIFVIYRRFVLITKTAWCWMFMNSNRTSNKTISSFHTVSKWNRILHFDTTIPSHISCMSHWFLHVGESMSNQHAGSGCIISHLICNSTCISWPWYNVTLHDKIIQYTNTQFLNFKCVLAH